MYNIIMYYLVIGLIWGLLNSSGEKSLGEKSNIHVILLILTWPFTMFLCIIGLIEAVIKNINNDKEM